MNLLAQDQIAERASRVYAYPVTSAGVWLTLWFELMLACLWIGVQGAVRFERGKVPGFVG